jgi:hypothetical protein
MKVRLHHQKCESPKHFFSCKITMTIARNRDDGQQAATASQCCPESIDYFLLEWHYFVECGVNRDNGAS